VPDASFGPIDCRFAETPYNFHSPHGRGCGDGRGLGMGLPLGVGVGRGVEVAVAVGVGVGVGVGVAHGVSMYVRDWSCGGESGQQMQKSSV
jgi:hypothetical protein